MRHSQAIVVTFVAAFAAGCSNADRVRAAADVRPTYDKATGRLTELALDSNHDGRPDTWTDMDGARPVQTRIDSNADGKIDRWEYYDAAGRLTRVGLSQKDNGKPDAWAYEGPDGAVARLEISASSDEKQISRIEHYEQGLLVAVEEDTNGDAAIDKWETYRAGALAMAAFDEDFDGRADRRLSYEGDSVVTIDSHPDAAGLFRQRVNGR